MSVLLKGQSLKNKVFTKPCFISVTSFTLYIVCTNTTLYNCTNGVCIKNWPRLVEESLDFKSKRKVNRATAH